MGLRSKAANFGSNFTRSLVKLDPLSFSKASRGGRSGGPGLRPAHGQATNLWPELPYPRPNVSAGFNLASHWSAWPREGHAPRP